MARKLRIAASVSFGLLTVALCMLWVRSLAVIDVTGVRLPGNTWLTTTSAVGEIEVSIFDGGLTKTVESYGFQSIAIPSQPDGFAPTPRHWPRFKWLQTPYELRVSVPTFIFIAAAGLCAGATWLPYQRAFSLRTLLIATTLVSIVLGLGVWLAS